MDVETLALFLLVTFRDFFSYVTAIIIGFYMVIQLVDAIVQAITPNEKGGDS